MKRNDMVSIKFDWPIAHVGSPNLDDVFSGTWWVSCNYDFYVLDGGYPHKGSVLPDRVVTTCVIRHNYKYYSGVAVRNPKDTSDLDKAQKVAFERCLDSIIIDAQMTMNKAFSKRFCSDIRKIFWSYFLPELL